ncbi:MAG TPA: hypothetical protein VMU39_00160 [Solirubrobacteraceae bacterium]|nr:hypothetical protein [Solirubrobacteraceae bacterium]
MSDESAQPDQPADAESGGAPAAAAKAEKPKKKPPAKSKDAKSKDAKSKGKSKGGAKGKSKGGVSVASYPRAHAQVRRAKGWGGLAGFMVAAYLSYRAGVPPPQIGLRALAAGVVGYLVAWAAAVTFWRQFMLAEIRARYEQRKSAPTAGTIPIKSGSTSKEDRPAA